MRAKVILSAVVLGFAVLLPAVYIHFKPSQPQTPAPVAATSDDSTNTAPSALPPILHRASSLAQDQGQGVANSAADGTALSHEDYLTKRKAELYELGMSDDPANLKTILSELHNPDPEIRQTALSATMDFGSQDAIPALQNEMMWSDDPQEKVDIKKAIEFLQLPKFGSDGGGSITQNQ